MSEKIGANEVAELRELFNILDTNKDVFITKEELNTQIQKDAGGGSHK